MATHTGIWRIVIIPFVADEAIRGDCKVLPGQRVIIVMYGEQGRLPPGISSMACLAFVRNTERVVAGIYREIKIAFVASHTNSRRPGISFGVAFKAISGNMRPRQREVGAVMVKTP